MANNDHVSLVRKGANAVADWRGGDRFRHIDLNGAELGQAELANVDLSGADLRGADLRGARLDNADLSSADCTGANLNGARLCGARFGYGALERASLRNALLTGAEFDTAALQYADLTGADLGGARLSQVGFQGATLRAADLSEACLRIVGLDDADLRDATLHSTHFDEVDLYGANLSGAKCWGTLFCTVDLSKVAGLEAVVHSGPSEVAQSTLRRSRGCIPAAFLRGCGFADWEIHSSRLHDSELTTAQITDLQYKIFDSRAKGLFLRRVFVSYAHEDLQFVEQLRGRLIEERFIVWLDRYDAVAGALQKQVTDAISSSDVVVLVLSKHAVESDWFKNELELARRKEKSERRDVLCPITLDESWTRMLEEGARDRSLWREVGQMLVVDFAGWRAPDGFEQPFRKLARGLTTNYEPR